ncbi:MAG TPA: hypothetical protein VNN80_34105 [Polyangiaceae bacterium]|jgi:hypothetical protein|nr:hypothetical protein [Polyangiaceae bacterium]
MDTSTFDPSEAVVFDLDRGQVTLEGGGPLLLLPAEVVAAACAQLDAALVRQLGIALGKQAGARVRARLASVAAPSLEVMVEQLAGELSLGGFGALAIERWGQALVTKIEGYPLAAHGQELLGGFLEGALLAAVEREVVAMPLERSAQSLRLLLCSRAASARVKTWLGAGGSWGDALAALHQAPRNDVGGRA